METILEDQPNKKVIMLGNEAIVRGALEAGVQFVSTYPGTPASEIGNTFARIAKRAGVYFEFSVNEKVALEAAAGAAFSGLRSLAAMKHFGLNVASDFLVPLVYTGVKGGLVLVVADDPGCSSSAQSEQDSRAYSYLAHIPTLEPSTPQECKDFTKLAFEISEQFEMPVMLRETTRTALQGGMVELGKLNKDKKEGKFVKNPRQFVTMPPRVLEMHGELLERITQIRKFAEKSGVNNFQFPISNFQRKSKSQMPKLGIIALGVAYLYVMEALQELGLDIPVLKLGFFYPLPEEKIKKFLAGLKKVLVVEELDPYLEREVKILAKENHLKLQIFGKDLVPEVNELKPEHVIRALAVFANQKLNVNSLKIKNLKFKIPVRHPQLCPGCPYWLVFQAVKKAVEPGEVVFGGEIGCYMLAGLPPHHLQDYLFCMGSGLGVGHGIKKANPQQRVITFIGDSSFFHAGIPALINAVYNQSNPLMIVMDNSTTAMTGYQPHPGIGQSGRGEPAPVIKIEEIVKACGVKNIKIIDPVQQQEFIKTVQEFLNKTEVSVIIASRPCKFVQRQ